MFSSWISNITGPIFSKELILAARKKRQYALRTLYVLAMLAVVMSYGVTVYSVSSWVYRVSAMSELGLALVTSLGCFQFFALQLIAPALTGSTISEELRKQTLASLIMTPINGFQIVIGKLLSRVFLILLLVATSFPLLAIVRVFGGVEWNFLLALEGLTVCAALFAAALSMTFSTLLKKQAHDSAAATYIFLLLIYIFIPLGIYALFDYLVISRAQPEYYYSFFNPFFSITLLIQDAQRPGSATFPGLSAPLIQCGLLLGGTLLLIFLSSALVRRAALKQGEGPAQAKPQRLPGETFVNTPESRLLDWAADRPVLWRELRKSLWKSPLRRNLSLGISLALLVGSYIYLWNHLQEPEPHLFFIEVFFLVILIQTCSLAAPTLAADKETNTMELLLTTPITPREILWEKVLGLLPKLLPLISLLIFHLFVFGAMGILPPFYVLEALIILAGPLVFLIGMGIYFSLRAKLIRNARVSLFGLAILLWAPCCPLTTIPEVFHMPFNPFITVALCLTDRSRYSIFGSEIIRPILFHLVIVGVSLLYAYVGYAFFNLGVRQFYRFTLEQNKS